MTNQHSSQITYSNKRGGLFSCQNTAKLRMYLGQRVTLTDVPAIVAHRPHTYDRRRTRQSDCVGRRGGEQFFDAPPALNMRWRQELFGAGVSYQHEQGSCHGYRSISCNVPPTLFGVLVLGKLLATTPTLLVWFLILAQSERPRNKIIHLNHTLKATSSLPAHSLLNALWNSKVHFHTPISPPLAPILSSTIQFKPSHHNYFILILPS
jgi:hypothetical protein